MEKALIAEYRGHEHDAIALPGIDAHLTELGFAVEQVKTGILDGVEKMRVAVIKKNSNSEP